MSLRVKSLATGSSGNVILVQAGETSLLVDCGLPTRQVEEYLRHRHIDPASLAGILLTHEHSDHIQSAGVMARRYNVPIIANRRTLDAGAAALGGDVPLLELATGSSRTLGDIEAASFPIPHDAAEPVGYLLSYKDRHTDRHTDNHTDSHTDSYTDSHTDSYTDGHTDWHVCIILDAGKPSYEMRPPLRTADLVIIEANHDRERLIAGPYTRFLKARILSEAGHLSNVEAAQLLAETANGKHKWAWLAHLSEVNNTPRLAMRTVRHYLRHEGVTGIELAIAQRDRPSVHWDSNTAVWQEPLPMAGADEHCSADNERCR
jgi:phosphoribosyl 1,2-cyclic phosphodiesterase